MSNLDLTKKERKALSDSMYELLEDFYGYSKNVQLVSPWKIGEIRKYASQYDFNNLAEPKEVLSKVIEGMKKYAIHAPHPGYLGLFNPRPNYVSVLADHIASVLNPNLAAWSHAPYGIEVEQFVINEFGKKFGYDEDSIDGTFCTGGAESNLTAVLSAINHHFPDFSKKGWIGTMSQPIIYCSSESHHSIVKAAKAVGLGTNSIVNIPVTENLTMNTHFLNEQIKKDKAAGLQPFMIVATAGTTGAGAIDNMEEIGKISKVANLWFHVDAAYGGAIIASPNSSKWLKGIELTDSITLDLHKWFSVAMGASLFLTSNKKILHKTFQIAANYMPKDGNPNQVIDPYLHSIQWSRRFIGLKIYLPLAIYGWKGFEKTINQQVKMGNELRQLLTNDGWEIKNDSKLPIVCFSHPDLTEHPKLVEKLVERVVETGKAWISVYPISGKDTIRACITNYQTTKEDLKEYVDIFNQCKDKVLEPCL